jgi:hypothetical protein
LVAAHEGQGIHIDRQTAAARLHFDGYDHGLAVSALLLRAHNSARPTAS